MMNNRTWGRSRAWSARRATGLKTLLRARSDITDSPNRARRTFTMTSPNATPADKAKPLRARPRHHQGRAGSKQADPRAAEHAGDRPPGEVPRADGAPDDARRPSAKYVESAATKSAREPRDARPRGLASPAATTPSSPQGRDNVVRAFNDARLGARASGSSVRAGSRSIPAHTDIVDVVAARGQEARRPRSTRRRRAPAEVVASTRRSRRSSASTACPRARSASRCSSRASSAEEQVFEIARSSQAPRRRSSSARSTTGVRSG